MTQRDYLPSRIPSLIGRIIILIIIVFVVQQSKAAGGAPNTNIPPRPQNPSLPNLNKPFSIKTLHHQLAQGQYTCEQLVSTYLTRIKIYNLDISRGGALNAYTSLNPKALERAKFLDEFFKRTGKFTGPLHCVTISIKDNIDTVNAFTTVGSLSLLGTQPTVDAQIVTQLKNAGAVILGKTAMDEFASGLSGTSSRTGRVGNAVDPTQNPGGSSSGSGAAVAAGFSQVAIGTDNSGSVRVPAAFNGVLGLRPSRGAVSQVGIYPRGNLDGIAGPIAQNISDLSCIMNIISKPDLVGRCEDHEPAGRSGTKADNILSEAKNLKGLRLGILQSTAGNNPFTDMPLPIQKMYYEFFNKLKSVGVTLVPITLPRYILDRKNNMAGEIEEVNAYLKATNSPRKNYKAICESDLINAFQSRADCLDHIKTTGKLYGPEYQEALNIFNKNQAYVESVMKMAQVVALIHPVSMTGKATYNYQFPDKWWAVPVASNAGLPALTMPLGYTNDNIPMPVGFEIIGKYKQDNEILSIGAALQTILPPVRIVDLDEPVQALDPIQARLKKMTISEYNKLLLKIGRLSYATFFKSVGKKEITAAEFNPIIQEILNH